MNRAEYLLGLLAEECCEVAVRVSKALRFGIDEVQPGQPLPNMERIQQEMIDVMAVVELLEADGVIVLGYERTNRPAIEAKKAKVEKFMAYSRELGTLTDDALSAHDTVIANHAAFNGEIPMPAPAGRELTDAEIIRAVRDGVVSKGVELDDDTDEFAADVAAGNPEAVAFIAGLRSLIAADRAANSRGGA